MITRRKFLTSIGQSAALLPTLSLSQLMGRAAFGQGTSASSAPLRFIALFSPHGTIRRFWQPRASADGSFSLSYEHAILAPLEKFKNQMIVLDGIDYKTLYKTRSSGHEGGMATALTGCRATKAGPVAEDCTYGSLDQFLAQRIGQNTRFSSLELGVGSPAGSSVMNTLCYGPKARRQSNIIDPQQLFDRIFLGLDPDSPQLALRQAMIEQALAELGALEKRGSADTRKVLEVHRQSLFELQKNLATPIAKGCKPPTPEQVAKGNPRDPDNFPAMSKSMIDQLALALHCQITSVATLQLTHGGSDHYHPFLGLNKNAHNDIAHKVPFHHYASRVPPEAVELDMLKLQRWYAEQVAYLMERLSQLPEGDGSVLDNTVILWVNELGYPASHTNMNVPMMILGGRGKKPQKGKWLRFSQDDRYDCTNYFAEEKCAPGQAFDTYHKPHNEVLLSIAKLFGYELSHFGDPSYGGIIPEILTS